MQDSLAVELCGKSLYAESMGRHSGITRKPLATAALFVSLLAVVACSSPSGTARPHYVPEDVLMLDVKGIIVEAWVENLEVPWSLIFLGDTRALVSERPGRIRIIKDGRLIREPYMVINVADEGEGGLMGLALHPSFPASPFVYAMHTYRKEGTLYNRVIRIRDNGNSGMLDKVIIDNIPGARFHDGGRIAFGPDNMLYITTGENFNADLAQKLDSLAGKILRLTTEGDIPVDNPFSGSPVYSYGHRNPQGLAWHPATGQLFSSEHGPSGEYLKFANDEINVINRGGNYGWPEIIGSGGRKPFIDPLIVWKKTTPPSGMTFYKGRMLPSLQGSLFVATLKSEALIKINLEQSGGAYSVASIERWFANGYDEGKYGRLRDVVEGPDGYIYFLTSNRDGRGSPRKNDDKIFRIRPGEKNTD